MGELGGRRTSPTVGMLRQSAVVEVFEFRISPGWRGEYSAGKYLPHEWVVIESVGALNM